MDYKSRQFFCQSLLLNFYSIFTFPKNGKAVNCSILSNNKIIYERKKRNVWDSVVVGFCRDFLVASD